MNTPRCKCCLQVFAALIVVCCGSILSAQSTSSQQSTFWGVLTDNEDQADQVLVRLLKDGTQFEIDKTRGEKYEVVIRRLIEASYNSSTDYLARVPVCVCRSRNVRRGSGAFGHLPERSDERRDLPLLVRGKEARPGESRHNQSRTYD